MKILQKIIFTIFIFNINTSHVMASNAQITTKSLNQYLDSLLAEVTKGGYMTCYNDNNSSIVNFNSCKTFHSLIGQNCYGSDTPGMAYEIRFKHICGEVNTLQQANTANHNYFNLDSNDWWESLPADVISIPGGVSNEEFAQKAKIDREKLVTGKLLGELSLKNIETEKLGFKAIISTDKDECGNIDDVFSIDAVLLADFDNDGIAELLLNGYRTYYSNKCFLGTGNGLGAEFSVLIKKESPTAKATIIEYPK